MNWIPPLVGFNSETLWSEVRRATHTATGALTTTSKLASNTTIVIEAVIIEPPYNIACMPNEEVLWCPPEDTFDPWLSKDSNAKADQSSLMSSWFESSMGAHVTL